MGLCGLPLLPRPLPCRTENDFRHTILSLTIHHLTFRFTFVSSVLLTCCHVFRSRSCCSNSQVHTQAQVTRWSLGGRVLSLGGTGQGQISSQTHTNTRANSSDFFGLIHRTHAFWMLMTLGLHAHAQFVFLRRRRPKQNRASNVGQPSRLAASKRTI